MDNKIIETAKKLKELAERGEGGEKHNAEYYLNKHLKKHNLTLEDILQDKKELRVFTIKNKNDLRFFTQVASSVLGDFTYKTLKKIIGIELTASEFFEIEGKFDFYSKAYQKELEIFYAAFIQRNHLYKKPSDDDTKKEFKELTPEKKEELYRVLEMSNTIKHHKFNKEIGN